MCRAEPGPDTGEGMLVLMQSGTVRDSTWKTGRGVWKERSTGRCCSLHALLRSAYGFNVKRWKATRLGRANKNAKRALYGNVHQETKEKTDLLATVAALKSNRAGEYMDGELVTKQRRWLLPSSGHTRNSVIRIVQFALWITVEERFRRKKRSCDKRSAVLGRSTWLSHSEQDKR